ncbi:hypothetical protein V9T40_002144 [Parthenolecanium corni]|uniref:alpha-glucosidase n=1 Tax=Parthenolecanium corni TaxID=536013 RepID=A0AAN9THY2_9HEMI
MLICDGLFTKQIPPNSDGYFIRIISKLDHLSDMHVDCIWITPFFSSSQDDMGYDITEYTTIDSLFGTMEDFSELIRETKKRGIKVIIDFVMNHSSDEHLWFKKSVEGIEPFDKYYVWQNATGFTTEGLPIPPNNWLSPFDGIAWKWNDRRNQFYLHQFGEKQPDFDLRNEKVRNEFKDILKIWLDRGVSGIRIDACKHFVEDDQLRDEHLKYPNSNNQNKNDWNNWNHNYTNSLPETFTVVRELREYMDNYSKEKGDYERVILIEIISPIKETVLFYGTEDNPIAQVPFFSEYVSTEKNELYSAEFLHESVIARMTSMPKNAVPNWLMESHDVRRIASRYVKEFTSILNIFTMMLPGIVCIYYGQEICMMDGPIRADQRQDHQMAAETRFSRDSGRTPMQWDDTINAGFTTRSKPWLPVNPNYSYSNLESQKKDNNSCYNIFKELTELRKTVTCVHGDLQSYVLSPTVYAVTRSLKGAATYVVVLNLGTEPELINLDAEIPNLPQFLNVLVASEIAGYKKG